MLACTCVHLDEQVAPISHGRSARTQGHSAPGHSHVGVRAVWVRASARRRGVASRLLEAVLGVDAALSCRLPRGRLAFTDPTADGLAFARAFLGQAGAFEPPRYTDTGVQAE